MLAFVSSFFLMIITPGPGVLTTAGIGAGFGWPAGIRFLVGLCIGTNLTFLMVATGLVASIDAIAGLRTGLLIASVAYFLYLAAKIALAGARVGFIQPDLAPTLWTGIGLQLVNPKAYVVNGLLVTGFPFYPQDLIIEVAWKFLLMNLVWVPVHLAWLGAGVGLRRLELSPVLQRTINVAMAIALVTVVLTAAFHLQTTPA
ncbi:MAG: LysE family translocator [Pseudomonadota bacterium]